MRQTGENFNNILLTHFLYESALRSFSLIVFWLWQKDFGKKALAYEKCECKMLMKLTTCENFTNILQAAFSCKSVLHSFIFLQFGFVIFFAKIILAQKLLVKC